jgi:hypothetical protein
MAGRGRAHGVIVLCACSLLLLLPTAAFADGGKCGPSAPVAVETIDDELGSAVDVADQPEFGQVTVKHVSKKPRRANRRLRGRGWGRTYAATRADSRTVGTAQMKLKRKRHRGKRSLMRLLVSVRGGLQA